MRLLHKELIDVRDEFSVSIKEGKTLFKLAMKAKEAIVEIGSWKGYSTIWLAKGSKAGNKVSIYAIDTFDGDIHNFVTGEGNTYLSFLNNIANKGVSDIINPIAMKSEDVAKGWEYRVDFLFIDGDHDEIDVDFKRWYPHLSVGGIMALHDTVYWHNMLPYKVAVKELYKSGKFANVKRVGCITYGQKVGGLSKRDRIRNMLALYWRYVYQLYIPYYTNCLILGTKILRRSK